MKIGFYGNANNYPFMLARALRRLGHTVEFIVLSREPLNRPEYRYSDITLPYPDWIHDLSHPLRWRNLLPGPSRKRALRILNACDAVILNEEGPALGRWLRPPSFCLLTGSDLEVFANPDMAPRLRPQILSSPRWLSTGCAALFPTFLIRRFLIERQRQGLRRSIGVNYFAKGSFPVGDRLLAEIGVPDSKRTAFLMTDLELIPYTPPPARDVVRIFCATRLTWVHEPGSTLVGLDYKGSDRMIHGLAMYYRRSGKKLDIHLVKKGRHVPETVRLLTELGMSDQVTWHEEMSQRQVLEQFRQADIVFEQLADGTLGMAGLDALATGRPLIIDVRVAALGLPADEPSPLCLARTAEEVCDQLARLVESPAERLRVGQAGRHCVEAYFSSTVAARRCLQSLQSAVSRPH